jgi:RNA polymerase sigma factor (sigma-70 family)
MSTAPAWNLPERWDAVLEHRDRALRVARARLSDPYDVDDCVQEGMARVVAMPNLDLGRVGPLLSTVVANVAADTHRQHVRSHRLSSKVASTQVPVQAGDEQICDAAEARWLRSQLDTLGERERSVLELRAEGRTVAETAAALGMTYKAAESAFTRGRHALKALWRATLVAVGAATVRGFRSSERTAAAVALAAAMSFAVAVQFVPQQPTQAQHVTSPAMPETAYRAVTLGPSSANDAPRTGTEKVVSQRSAHRSQELANIQPPHTYARPGRIRVTREHPDESFLDTVQRCIRKGLTIRPDKIRCDD